VDNDGVAEILIGMATGYLRIYDAQPRATGLLKTVPSLDAIGIQRNVPIEFTFDELMDSASVASALTISPSVAFQTRWVGTRLIVGAEAPLDSNTAYTVTIRGTALNNWGTPLGGDVSISFTTGADIRRARLTGFTPTNGAANVQGTDFIRCSFSAGIIPTSVPDAISFTPPLVGSWTFSDTAAVFAPSQFLKAGRYQSTVFPTAHDASGQVWDVNNDGSVGVGDTVNYGFVVLGGVEKRYRSANLNVIMDAQNPTNVLPLTIPDRLDSALVGRIEFTPKSTETSEEMWVVVNASDTLTLPPGSPRPWVFLFDGQKLVRGANTVTVGLRPSSDGVQLVRWAVTVAFTQLPVSVEGSVQSFRNV
jgi:hypothetical protein